MTTPEAEDASPSPEYSGDQDGTDMAEQKVDRASSDASPSQQTSNGQKSASNAKDPLRPRRKKARRACYACQRAHLTCGDERPCHRCIKRGLQDACMDGVRKKAKYLHDAPNEALMPGVGGNYHPLNGSYQATIHGQVQSAVSLSQPGSLYSQAPSNNFNVYAQQQQQGQMTPVQDGPVMSNYGNQQTPISPPYSQGNHQAPIQNISSMPQGSQPQIQSFGGPLFDPSDPALFNFDIASLNFGNHYGALEFGMLGHMSSGAADTPPSDNSLMNPLNQAAGMYNPQMSSGAYSDNPAMAESMPYNPNGMPNQEWQNSQSRQGSINHVQTPNNTPNTVSLDHAQNRHDSMNGLPPAFAIRQGPSSLSSASPASTGAEATSTYDTDNPMSSAVFFATSNQQVPQRSPTVNRPSQHGLSGHSHSAPLQPIQSNQIPRKRRRETSYIYDGIKEPFDYAMGFHRVRELTRTRFPQTKVVKIAEAISKFRPTLIITGADLDRNDLIHNEKNLQRTLLSLEDTIDKTGTPTLILRRTGEVALIGKEFSILTGWQRDVLLGKEPNLNVNVGSPSLEQSLESSGTTSRSGQTPQLLAQQEESAGPRAVTIIDLMDEDSVVQFFEDFSNAAWIDSKITRFRRVKFLKYRTKEDMARLEEMNAAGRGPPGHGGRGTIKYEQPIKLESHSEAGMGLLGDKDGTVECMIGWHVRRDLHDLPMLIFINVLPIL